MDHCLDEGVLRHVNNQLSNEIHGNQQHVSCMNRSFGEEIDVTSDVADCIIKSYVAKACPR
jgi:hypothetical protein